MGGDSIEERILNSLQEKPRSISEIARELDEEKYAISKKIEVLVDQGKIDTYRIGRSTACMLADNPQDDHSKGQESDTDTPSAADHADRTEPAPSRQPPRGPGASNEHSSGRANAQDDIEDWFEQAWDESGRRSTNSVAPDTVAQSQSRATQQRSRALSSRKDAHAASSAPTTSAQKKGPRTIGVVSGKGGVGKTVVTLNLGTALMDLGENVIVMDSDAEMPNVGLHLGMYTYPTSLKQVVEQDVHIMSAMHVDKDSGLRVIPTSLSKEPVKEHVMAAIQMIPDEYIVLIDSPPGMDRPIERVIDTCEELLFVTTPEIPSVTDTYKLVQEAKKRDKKILGAVINMYSSPKKHLSVAEVEKSLELPVLGVIDHSKVIQQSIFDTQPAVSMKPHAKPCREFKQIAADLTGRSYEPSVLERIRGFMP